jgi:hypothetical protein
MLKNKSELLKECVYIMTRRRVKKWYKENLDTKPQVETLDTLQRGIISENLTTKEALAIALITGVQWNIKFEGTP